MQKYNIEKWFIEKVSAKDTNRPKLQEMLEFCREGDTVHIHDFSRLARSTKDLLDIVELLNHKRVTLISNKENIDTSTPTGKLMLTMIGAINEFERTNLLERQKEGIAIAKREGKYKGGKCKKNPNFAEHYAQYLSRQISKADLAKKLGISRPTLDKLITEYNNNNLRNSI
jgi:DNA invertase Pin-like site-specific DNA recombinase